MPEEFDDPEGRDELEQPPAFFPFGSDSRSREAPDPGQLIEVAVEGVYEAQKANQVQRFVLLSDGERQLPIMIGGFEATAISMPLENQRPDRPLTHDLIRNMLDRLGATVDRVVIDDLWNAVYYAKIYVRQGKAELEIDARPSDAIAVAVRFDAPILVSEAILESGQID